MKKDTEKNQPAEPPPAQPTDSCASSSPASSTPSSPSQSSSSVGETTTKADAAGELLPECPQSSNCLHKFNIGGVCIVCGKWAETWREEQARAPQPVPQPAQPSDDRVCSICDGGPGNDCQCSCGAKAYQPSDENIWRRDGYHGDNFLKPTPASESACEALEYRAAEVLSEISTDFAQSQTTRAFNRLMAFTNNAITAAISAKEREVEELREKVCAAQATSVKLAQERDQRLVESTTDELAAERAKREAAEAKLAQITPITNGDIRLVRDLTEETINLRQKLAALESELENCRVMGMARYQSGMQPGFHWTNERAERAESDLAQTRVQLEKARAKLDYVHSMGLRFGMMETSDKPAPYLAHTWTEDSDHERMFREWSASIGWQEKLAAVTRERDGWKEKATNLQ